jgi:pyrimidine operon attenuation protein/uracil phosphoribosyltransferase
MTLQRMKRNSDLLSRLVILVDDVVAIRTVRTAQLDLQVCRQPARLHAASWSLITFTNHSEQDMFTVVVGLKGSCRRASRRRPDLRALRRR